MRDSPLTTFGLALTVGIAAISLSACTSDDSSDSYETEPRHSSNFVGYSGAEQEYWDTVDELEWPEEAEDPKGFTRSDKSASYGVGIGAGDAVRHWNCAWGKEWLELRSVDSDSSDDALDMYAEITETDVFANNYDEHLQDHLKNAIEQAELGDPSEIQNEIEVVCGG